jgi:hypothetical protein
MEALILVFSHFYQFVNQITGFLIKSFLFGNTPSFWVIVVISSMEFYLLVFRGKMGGNAAQNNNFYQKSKTQSTKRKTVSQSSFHSFQEIENR